MLSLIHFATVLLLTGGGIYTAAHLLYSRVMFIRLGRKSNLKHDAERRFREFVVNVFGQSKLLKDKKSGMMHLVMFYGFIVLQFGAVELILKGFYRGFEYPIGEAHRYFSLLQEMAVCLVLSATAYAFYRRFIERLSRLSRGIKPAVVLLFITVLMCSILMSLAFERI